MNDYIITNHINIKQFSYAINNFKILYYVSNKNPRSLLKTMIRIEKQLRKLYGKEYKKHLNRCQIVDTYTKVGKISKRLLSGYNSQIHNYYHEYNSIFYGGIML